MGEIERGGGEIGRQGSRMRERERERERERVRESGNTATFLTLGRYELGICKSSAGNIIR